MNDDHCFLASAAEFHQQLPLPASSQWPEGVRDIAAFARKGMAVLYFAPRGEDHQDTHEQDEIYFVISGSASLQLDGAPRPVSAGVMAYVPAGMPHRFTGISDDFATWAVFFGRGL